MSAAHHHPSFHRPGPLSAFTRKTRNDGLGCWSTYYRLGVEMQRRLEVQSTYAQIGTALGISTQTAYTVSVVALGKLVFRLRRSFS